MLLYQTLLFLPLMSEGLLKDALDTPASGTDPASKRGHRLHEYIGTVTERQRNCHLSGRCRVSCWIDLRYQFMLESLDVLREERSQAATLHLVAAPVQVGTWLFSAEWV